MVDGMLITWAELVEYQAMVTTDAKNIYDMTVTNQFICKSVIFVREKILKEAQNSNGPTLLRVPTRHYVVLPGLHSEVSQYATRLYYGPM